jgi:hypothetical protein
MMQAPMPRTWWVKDGLFLAGCFPGDYHDVGTETKLRCLLETGVRCFVSLQQPGEMSWSGPFTPYAQVAQDLAKEMNIEVTCLNFPIVDMGVPTKALMQEILDAIEESLRNEQCVYVHCWGGHGRTGAVVGCWLREQGMSGKETLQHIRKLRQHDPHLVQWESPQTPAQRNMILQWE